MTPEQLHILQHSLGLDKLGRGTMYRNSFVTGKGCKDHPACMALTKAGLMRRCANVAVYGGMDIFTVTDEGKKAVAQHNSDKAEGRANG